jgi:hypothetical protein
MIIAGAAQRLGNTRTIGLVAGAAFFFVPYLWSGNWNVLSGYADFPLGVLYLAAVSRLSSLTPSASLREFVLFGVLAGFVPWGKHEGFYLWLVLMAIAVNCLGAKHWRRAVIVAAPGLVISIAFLFYLKLMGAPDDPFYQSPSPANLLAHADRIRPMFIRLGNELINFESWTFLWIGAALAIIALICRGRLSLALRFSGAIGLPLFMFVWPFVLSALDDYLQHAYHALPRLLLQIAPTAMLAIIVAVPRPPGRSESP